MRSRGCRLRPRRQAGFTETGADSLDLTVAQQTTNSLRTVLGAQLGAASMRRGARSSTYVRLGWSHDSPTPRGR